MTLATNLTVAVRVRLRDVDGPRKSDGSIRQASHVHHAERNARPAWSLQRMSDGQWRTTMVLIHRSPHSRQPRVPFDLDQQRQDQEHQERSHGRTDS
jgi:hypothetical protein